MGKRLDDKLKDYKTELVKLLKNRIRRKILLEIINAPTLDAVNSLLNNHLKLSQKNSITLLRFEEQRENYKKKIINLLNQDISNDLINEIEKCASIKTIDKLLEEKLVFSQQEFLAEKGIKYFMNKFKIRPNTEVEGIYYDKISNNIRLIFTPMGNKR